MIIVMAFTLVVISIGLAPGRGLFWRWLRQRGQRKQFATQTVLDDLFHYAYDHGDLAGVVPESFLLGVSGDVTRLGLTQLEQQGFPLLGGQ